MIAPSVRCTTASNRAAITQGRAQRIVVLGRGGAGKSTLARRLAATTALPLTELGDLFRSPDAVSLPRERWAGIQRELIAQPAWILDGDLAQFRCARAPASRRRHDRGAGFPVRHLCPARAAPLPQEPEPDVLALSDRPPPTTACPASSRQSPATPQALGTLWIPSTFSRPPRVSGCIGDRLADRETASAAGRPRKLTTAQLAAARAALDAGQPVGDAAPTFGVTRATLYRYLSEQPEQQES